MNAFEEHGAAAGCPFEDFTFATPPRPPLSGYAEARRLASLHPSFRSSEPPEYWVFTSQEAIREGLQQPHVFSSRAMVVTEPHPPYLWIPEMLDPPEHTAWRQLLAPLFSPASVQRRAGRVQEVCVSLIDDLVPVGTCDFVADFAARFPTTIFLELMGLPVERLDEFQQWQQQILHWTPESDPDATIRMTAMHDVTDVFAELIASLRRDPSLLGDDLVSHAVGWQIDGHPIADDELLSFCLLMFMAGLDTVAAQLSYMFFHLAQHPSNRARLARDPGIIPQAVEEMLRAFPIVQPGRTVTHDNEFHGRQLKSGDMVLFSLPFAGNDASEWEDPATVDFDRGALRHLSFGAGPHRCLGSHLARLELTTAIREWHARIPSYELSDPDTVVEHTGGVYGINALPLRWAEVGV